MDPTRLHASVASHNGVDKHDDATSLDANELSAEWAHTLERSIAAASSTQQSITSASKPTKLNVDVEKNAETVIIIERQQRATPLNGFVFFIYFISNSRSIV